MIHSRQKETEFLRAKLNEFTEYSSDYKARASGAATPEYREKMQRRYARYEAVRALIADLMIE